MLSLYHRLQPFLLWALRRLARRSAKFAELLAVREGVMDRWRAADLGQDRVWVHVSSVGELEQARPVIEYLGAQRRHDVVVSYFSTSVTKLVKDWSFVKHADFLPLDEAAVMEELVALIRPRALLLNRYDLWPNHVLAAKRAGIPVLLINASTPPLGWFGRLSLFARRALFGAVDGWTFVDAAAAAAWEPYLNEHARGLVAGNPRVDRALARTEQLIAEGRAQARLALWRRRPLCLVAGSTWPQDEETILDAWERIPGARSLVIVPHEPDEPHLCKLEEKLRARGLTAVRFTRIEEGEAGRDAEVLVVDQRGFLAEIYGLGQLAYVGGGFGKQIHSIIEPVAHGLLVAFGPHYDRSPEAHTLCATGAARAVAGRRAGEQLAAWIREMSVPGEERVRAAESLKVFLQVHRGAGERVGQFVEESLRR